ncbi:MAG: hypothetical protein DWG80_01245 [Chloroflexi bacterium]|nr:hypothetical protein [Chloroflexota bacterium]
MPEISDVRVLVTGDDEADLTLVRAGLVVPSEVAQGLSLAVAAMRMREFGVLIADVRSAQDALALLRAARRGRPPTRGIVLIPADHDAQAGGWELVARAAFAMVRHPLEVDALGRVIDDARREYIAELRGFTPSTVPEAADDAEGTRWLLAERRLAAVLRRTVTRWSTRSQGGVDVALLRGVEAVAEAARAANASPEMLLAIADALSAEKLDEKKGEAA